MVDSNARYINPEGVGLAIAVLSPIVLLFSIAGVAIRVHMRRREGALAVDDALLIGGLVRFFSFLSIQKATYKTNKSVFPIRSPTSSTHV